MNVLGISAFYHDSAAALVRDGEIVAAAQEERFSRLKFDAGFPGAAVAYCLEAGGVQLDELDAVGFYDKPLLTFDRLLETYFAFAPSGFRSFVEAMPTWLKRKLLLRKLLVEELNELGRGTASPEQLRFGYHHHSHAASAFLPSPFDTAAVLVMDGVGEWATTTIGHGRDGGDVELLREIRFPHSLGLLYAAFTYYLGFKVNSGEFKVMGLAPYGEPRYRELILEHLIDLKDDGSFRLDLRYFNYCTGLTMTNDRFAELFGVSRRQPESPLTQEHMDIAASVQEVTEEVVLRLCRTARRETGERNLCLAGGVALNCVASGKVVREGIFDRLWIQPAAGDAGGALGVALAVAHAEHESRPAKGGRRDAMAGAYLGPEFSRAEIISVLESFGAVYHQRDPGRLFDEVVDALAGDKVVGWFRGRMEFGPRALGNRSILGDARSPKMQRVINLKIKYREGFRPFAPAVLRECVGEYFDFDFDSPYMLLVGPVSEQRRRALSEEEQRARGLEKLNQVRSDIPAVTHINHSARIQTVHADTNPAFHQLLTRFRERTGYGVVVNTSFNIRGEPIVCSPEDAYRCFMGTEMDVLALEDFLLFKAEQ